VHVYEKEQNEIWTEFDVAAVVEKTFRVPDEVQGTCCILVGDGGNTYTVGLKK